MSKSNQRWFLLFIYLLVSCMVSVALAALIAKIAIEFFFVIFYQLPFDISKADVFKCLKAGSAGGAIAGIGCWFLYYQNRSDRK